MRRLGILLRAASYSHDSHCKQNINSGLVWGNICKKPHCLDVFQPWEWWTASGKLLFHESKEASRDGWNMQWHERALMLVGINPSPQPMDRSMNDSRYVHLISVQMLIAILFANNSRIVSKLWQLCLESIDWSRGKDMEDEMIFYLEILDSFLQIFLSINQFWEGHTQFWLLEMYTLW